MLRSFDGPFTPDSLAAQMIDRVFGETGEHRYWSWKAQWEVPLRKNGWVYPSELPTKIRKKLLTSNGLDDHAVDLVHPSEERMLTFLTELICPCCTERTNELRRLGYDALAIVDGEGLPGFYRLRENKQLETNLPFRRLKGCYDAGGIIDFRGKPYRMKEGSNIAEGLFDPVTDEEITQLFKLRMK